MRITAHTPVGVFGSRILNDAEFEIAFKQIRQGYDVSFESQMGQSFIIPKQMIQQSVFEFMPNDNIQELPQFVNNPANIPRKD